MVIPKTLLIPPVFIVFSLVLIIVFYFFVPGYTILLFPYNWTGVIVSFFGFSIMGRSRDLFRKHSASLSGSEPAFLIKEGVYLKSRNPMYLGMFLLLLGTGICFGNVFSIAAPLLFVLLTSLITIPGEEKALLEKFGKEYQEYRNEVRRWL